MVGMDSMPVLEPAELDKRYAQKALTILQDDSSVHRFDEILRADQVAPGTRSTYLWQLVRLKRAIPDFKGELGQMSEEELHKGLAKLADQSKGTGFQLTARTMKRFYKSIGRVDLVAKIRVPPRKPRIPEILTEAQLKLIIEKAGGPEGNLRNRVIVELLWESGCRVGELCNLKNKDVQFDQYSAIVHLNGKTGQRRVRVFACRPDLLEYVNQHPFKNNPDEYFFLSHEGRSARSFHRLERVLLQDPRGLQYQTHDNRIPSRRNRAARQPFRF